MSQVLPSQIDDAAAPVAKPRPTKANSMGKWMKGLLCGSLSLITCCCCCCGAAGHIKAPQVLYDDEDLKWDTLNRVDQRVINSIQWCGLAGLASKCIPLACGCCCGLCGNVTPIEGAMCIGAMAAADRRR
jgi:hypothetical protein